MSDEQRRSDAAASAALVGSPTAEQWAEFGLPYVHCSDFDGQAPPLTPAEWAEHDRLWAKVRRDYQHRWYHLGDD